MKNGVNFSIFILVVISVFGLTLANFTKLFLREDALLNFTQLASKYGHTAEQYEVTTEDGYILKIFRIPSKGQQISLPILLMHGVLDTADTWIIRGNGSLAITLANAGYDVWCGNVRGNRYSRGHVYLNADKDDAYWDFTFNEYAIYDLASTIDFVLIKSGAPKLNAIGHSQGTTIFFVLGSTKTVYNSKVNVLIALAPICYLQDVHKPLATLIKFSPELYRKGRWLGLNEVPGRLLSNSFTKLCSHPVVGYVKCIVGLFFPITGYDTKQLEPSFVSVSMGHFPSATSLKNLYHFGQVGRRKTFARFDYGPERNLELYGTVMPPNYDLSQVTMQIVLLVGKNDYISVVKDVALLRVQLPNVVRYSEIDYKLMNHIDFVWGRNMDDYLFPYIFGAIRTFT